MRKDKRVEPLKARVRITTIQNVKTIGYINIRGYDRLSDYIKNTTDELFLTVFDIEAHNNAVILYNRVHIISIEDLTTEGRAL